jgi:hypothetical protein
MNKITNKQQFIEWVSFYSRFDPSFNWQSFEISETDSLQILSGSVQPIWHPQFKSYYRPLLIWSPDSTRYLDIDSYLWFVIDKNATEPEIGYSPDQEINLVDLNDSTVNRIAFRGPNQRVEEALWLDEQTISLLENNQEGQPMVSIIELNEQTISYFQYPDSVTVANGYWQNRIEKALQVLPEFLSTL